jgi:hypothetical protein
MKNLTYKIYRANPEIRDQIEREARRARNEAINQFVITPLVNACGRLLKRAGQALVVILTLANYRFYSPGRISGSEFNCNTQPRS